MASVNLCGIVVIYQDYSHLPKRTDRPSNVEYPASNSRKGRQKRQIANACEWIRINSHNKVLILTLTAPVPSDYETQNKNVSLFFNNFKKNYHCQDYVWVREYQKNGRPHWHTVADVPFFDVRKVNSYWSGLWGSEAKNSLRMNHKTRRFLSRNPERFCWYLTKYIGKDIGKDENNGSYVRKFAISQRANRESQPETFFASEIYDKLNDYDIRPVGSGVSFAVPKSWNKRKTKKAA